ncbi:MAG: hypothetical protein KKB31_02660, partial [Nanoarchaeota archaeon]|nr:hypothetical protein [Nanoarchaeota archaeon]
TYIIASMITQINGTYNYDTGIWSWTEETPIVQEAIDIKTKYSIKPPVVPIAGGWNKFWNTIKELWCKLLPFFCSS